jgi:hypothetical protein
MGVSQSFASRTTELSCFCHVHIIPNWAVLNTSSKRTIAFFGCHLGWLDSHCVIASYYSHLACFNGPGSVQCSNWMLLSVCHLLSGLLSYFEVSVFDLRQDVL